MKKRDCPESKRRMPLGVAVASMPENRVWHGIKNRCYREVDKSYPDYGGRGVKMCDEWRDSFVAFYRYVGPRPTPDHSIERIENDKDYEPGNVRWATRAEQVINKRNNRWLEYNGERFTLAQAAKQYGMRTCTLWNRLRRGLTLSDALTSPVRGLSSRHLPRPNRRILDPHEEAEIVALFRGGRTKLSLAKQYGISTSTVLRILTSVSISEATPDTDSSKVSSLTVADVDADTLPTDVVLPSCCS